MEPRIFHLNDIRDVGRIYKAYVGFFILLGLLYVVLGWRTGRGVSVIDLVIILVITFASPGFLYLHGRYAQVTFSDKGINTSAGQRCHWRDVTDVTIHRRASGFANRIIQLHYVNDRMRGPIKISTSPEETDEILSLLRRYLPDHAILEHTHS